MSILNKKNTSKNKSQRNLSTMGFALFFAWVLAIPFEGQVLYSFADNVKMDVINYNMIGIFIHFIALFMGGFFIKKQVMAKITAIVSIIVCICGSLIFFLPFSILWYISHFTISFFAGLVVCSWGFYYKEYSKRRERIKTAADVLIISNIAMISCNVAAVNLSPFIGLILAIIYLSAALLIFFRLEAHSRKKSNYRLDSNKIEGSINSILRPLIFLCLFILIITINSGIMYQVVVPEFSHLELLSSYYWAVPYIIALLIVRNMPKKVNRAYVLYIALAMIGFSFIFFLLLDRSVMSYLIIDTLMLGAFGVCDLFWWSILGGLFDYSNNPAKVLGIGLSMNVLGIFLGIILANNISSFNSEYLNESVIALIIVFIVIIILPIINYQLTKILKEHSYLVRFGYLKEGQQSSLILDIFEDNNLTERETEIVNLLLRGYTYKAISDNLNISQNTTKFHIKNIYQKLNVNNKMELIKLFTEI